MLTNTNSVSKYEIPVREREMVLRDISREKCGARNCEKNLPNFGHFLAHFDQNLNNFQCKVTLFLLKGVIPFVSISFSKFSVSSIIQVFEKCFMKII